MKCEHPAVRELRNQLASAPATYVEREQHVVEGFEQRGATPRRRPIRDCRGNLLDACNIEVTIPGDSELPPIYLTAHHDHVPAGHGVVDNWSGVVALFNLFERFRSDPLGCPLILVSFALEEYNRGRSLTGSRHYVRNLDGQPIHANVNLECLGPGPLHYWTYGRSKIAGPIDVPEAHYSDDLVSDAQSFHRQAGCPAIVFDGIAGVRKPIIHTERDRIEAINMNHYARSLVQIEMYVRALASCRVSRRIGDRVINPVQSHGAKCPTRWRTLRVRSQSPWPAR